MSERVWRPGLVAVLCVAALTRLSRPGSHFHEGRLVPRDADSAYHLRRALSFFEHPPWPSVHDPFLGFPEGATVPWAPGWDAYLALLGWVFGGFSPDGVGFDVGVAVGGLLVALVTCALAANLGRQLFGVWPGLAAGLFLALNPMHVGATAFACLDHNPAEGLFLLGLTAEASRRTPRWWVLGVLIAGACLAWVGGLLYAALGMGAVCAVGLLRQETPWASIGGMAFGVGLLTPPAVAMGVAGGTPFTYAYLSGFHPALLGVLTVGAAWLFALKASPSARRPLLALGALVGVGLAVALGPSVWTGLTEWLLTEDVWLATVQEMQPFLSNGVTSLRTWQRMVLVLSWLAPLTPLLLGGLAWSAWRRRQVDVVPLVLVTSGTTVLLLLQVRFGWTLAPLLGVVAAGALSRLPIRPVWVLGLILLANLHPPEQLRAAWVHPKSRQSERPHRFEAYHWIRDNTPPVDPVAPEYGVLSGWDHGHWLSGVSQRPEHIGHFGTYAGGVERYVATQAMFDGDESDLVDRMDANRLRYLVLEAQEVEGTPMSALMFGGDRVVTRLRAVFASSLNGRLSAPGAWVYERVAGATLAGRGEPGQTVTVEVMLQVAGHKSPWRFQSPVARDGSWFVRVPYWNGDAGSVATAPRTVVYLDGQPIGGLVISEEDVRGGAHYDLSVAPPAPEGG